MQLLVESQSDVVISVTVFVAAFIIVAYLAKFKSVRMVKNRKIIDNQYYIIESVLSKHLTKLDKIMSSMGELRARLDLLEDGRHESISQTGIDTEVPNRSRMSNVSRISDDENDHSKSYQNNAIRSKSVISQELHEKSHKHVRKESNSTRKGTDLYKDTKDTTIHIFELLRESPRNAREIQFDVGKTREHISRLMKKLHDEGLVSRNSNIKPFVYKITDEGHKLLE